MFLPVLTLWQDNNEKKDDKNKEKDKKAEDTKDPTVDLSSQQGKWH